MKKRMKFFFLNQEKYNKNESYRSRERFQVSIVLLPNYVWDLLKYIFTMMELFTKYGWIIPLNYKKAEMNLRALKIRNHT